MGLLRSMTTKRNSKSRLFIRTGGTPEDRVTIPTEELLPDNWEQVIEDYQEEQKELRKRFKRYQKEQALENPCRGMSLKSALGMVKNLHVLQHMDERLIRSEVWRLRDYIEMVPCEGNRGPCLVVPEWHNFSTSERRPQSIWSYPVSRVDYPDKDEQRIVIDQIAILSSRLLLWDTMRNLRSPLETLRIYACHRCNVPGCLSLAHIRLGTLEQNYRDRNLRPGQLLRSRKVPNRLLASDWGSWLREHKHSIRGRIEYRRLSTKNKEWLDQFIRESIGMHTA